MKQLLCEKPGSFVYRDVPDPTPSADHTILRVKHIGVCGTDIHAFAGNQPYFNYPRVLGHELSCEIVGGDIPPLLQLGDTVTVIPYVHCGKCIACRRGATNCCAQLQVLGVHIDGGMQEYISVPKHLILAGDDLDARSLALVEPLAIGAHAVLRSGMQPGDHVLVCGAGPIGLGTMAFAKQLGGHVIAVDTNAARLAFCRDSLHIPYTLQEGTENIMEALQEITHGDMPTIVFDATGNLKAIESAFQYLAHTGKYVLIGLQKEAIAFSHPEFHKREATVMSSRNALKTDFQFVMQHLQAGHIDADAFVTSTLSFNEVASDFTATVSNPTNIKTIINLP
jgi:2-desacetyl-2-hydroxyethyl bacteriochlorophyllide A dehydrogenase